MTGQTDGRKPTVCSYPDPACPCRRCEPIDALLARIEADTTVEDEMRGRRLRAEAGERRERRRAAARKGWQTRRANRAAELRAQADAIRNGTAPIPDEFLTDDLRAATATEKRRALRDAP